MEDSVVSHVFSKNIHCIMCQEYAESPRHLDDTPHGQYGDLLGFPSVLGHNKYVLGGIFSVHETQGQL